MRKQSFHKLALSLAALLACPVPYALAQTLAHRYSFNDTAGSAVFVDSVGGAAWNGNLQGSAILDGSQLQLDGFGSYGVMPAGMISGLPTVTIEFWASFSSSNPEWTRVFSFGDQEGSNKRTGLDYCHYAGGNWQNLGVTTPAGNVWANNPGGLNGVTNVHVTLIVDPANNQMFYYNGTAITSNPGVNGGAVPPLSGLVDTFALLGRSLYDLDATLAGSIDEFRVYSGVLSGQRVALNQAAGPDNYVTDPGALQAVHLHSPDNPLSVNQLSAQVFTGDFANVSGVNLALYGGATFTSGNISILTVDTNGVVKAVGAGTTTVVASFGSLSTTNTLSVIAVPAVLKHRYSFTTDASDSVGGANGTLQGSATISGGKAVLDGASGTYVDLPGSIINFNTNKSVTIAAWVDFGDVPNWSRLWNFGHDDASSEIYLAPRGPGNGGEHRLSQNISGGRTFDWEGTLSNQTAQVTVVIDPPTGTMSLYKNGKLEYAVYNATAPLSLVSNTMAVIGRSLVGVDPYMPGAIDDFRIYSGALSPEEIALVFNNGPASVVDDPGTLQSITVSPVVYPAAAMRMAPVILANFANLAGFNLLPNNSARIDGLTLTSSDTNIIQILANNMIQTFRPGQVTLTATYRGKMSSATVRVGNIAQLTHRYSFNDNANDSVGTGHGTFQGAAAVASGKLVLDGSDGTYLELPPGLLKSHDAVTIDTWVNFNAGSSWARLWYFGNDRADEFYLAPIVLDGNQHWFSTGFPIGGETITLPGRWDSQALHITCVYGNGTMAYYTNGVLHGGPVSTSGRADQIGKWFSWIGRSPHPDPFMNCEVDEFRVYNGRLSPEEILASSVLGPNTLLSVAPPTLKAAANGGNVTLTWPVSAAGFTVQGVATLGNGLWTTLTNAPALIGTEWQLSVPAASASQFYRLWK